MFTHFTISPPDGYRDHDFATSLPRHLTTSLPRHLIISPQILDIASPLNYLCKKYSK